MLSLMLSINSFRELPLDLKVAICKHDIDAWVKIALVDTELYKYTIAHRLEFVLHFTKEYIVVNKYWTIHKWKIFDTIHREELDSDKQLLPASYTIYMSGHIHQEWYQNGNLHRDNDLPAVIDMYKTKIWYQNGKIYRENDQPCKVYIRGKHEEHQWHDVQGRLHRTTGPARITHISREWWLNGIMTHYQ